MTEDAQNLHGGSWQSSTVTVLADSTAWPNWRSIRVGFRVFLRVREVAQCPTP